MVFNRLRARKPTSPPAAPESVAEPSAPVAAAIRADRPVRVLEVTDCPLCGDPLTAPQDGENCPTCASRARTRSLSPLLTEVVGPLVATSALRSRPLLAFAATAAERKLLAPVFGTLNSVSLFGSYGAGHTEGVDVRDLSRWGAGSHSGVFSILLFDYVEELDRAVGECARVIAPGGVLFTHIAPYRLVDGDTAPTSKRTITAETSKSWHYLGDSTIADITVGREWMLATMRRHGLDARIEVVHDTASGQSLDWFVGVRERPGARTAHDFGPTFASRTYSIPVRGDFDFQRVVLELAIPELPAPAAGFDFAEHDHRAATVVACGVGGICIGSDLGRTWEHIPVPELAGCRIMQTFTTQDGSHLAQVQEDGSWSLCRFDPDWTFRDRQVLGVAPWHGSRSIAEADGTILWAEYPLNDARYKPGFAARQAEAEAAGEVLRSRVFRSVDNGATWTIVFEQDWSAIRHFHTVISDPHSPGRWLLSSGDRPHECSVWESTDDGLNWRVVSDPEHGIQLHPAADALSAFRYTDLVVRPDDLIWGTDDLLGPARALDDPDVAHGRRVGSRLLMAPRETPGRPVSLGVMGNPVRSIVDAGAGFVVISEAKGAMGNFCPQVTLLTDEAVPRMVPLATVDNFAARPTGFTMSRASQHADGGVFFSFRDSMTVAAGGARVLRWRVELD